ncbi:Hsp33 family molecular chaperone HslO [Irregularibacter muris]|uniref:Hsp33 family molecular chaperone HslO n=1 Tax=Irregularibacter muris TaxID=1796619 RepID=A0AAE3L4B2_9FIRM|nr:Hsp33 family molecular chaperone HslO [Irregularibacter muris]MCR1899808.1 Hsp33 family molecular chaperone HslO [Irregularibacter muris]
MKNNLLKLLTKDKEVRLYIVDTTDILEHSSLKEMETDFAKELYTKIFTCCCLLRGFLTERDQRLDVSIRFKPEGHSVYCNIDGEGNIHCTFSSKLRIFNGEFKDLVGKGTTFSISRGSWMGGMFTGTIELDSDSVELCFSDFYSRSEQVETIFRIWVSNKRVRGCMIQPLPFAQSNNLKYVIDSIDSNQVFLSAEELKELPNKVFSYARVIEEYKIKIECNCSKEMFFGLLMSVEMEELKQAIQRNKKEEVECGICGSKYLFNKDDLKAIVKMKEGV